MSYKTYYATLPLPKCAVKINGEYIERTIVGYRTSSVSGREPLSIEISDLEIGNMNGSKYRRKKNKTRTISINFALMADTKTEYHDLLNKLKLTISEPEMQWIFRDEEDKYYTGTVESVEISQFNTAGSKGYGCSGSISVYCCDPYKYSVEEKEFTATLDNGYTFGVDYQGTAPCKPRFEFIMNSDNGYIGLLDQNGHILEFGNVDEANGTTKQRNERLVTLSNFKNAKDDIGGYDVMHPNYGSNGQLGTGLISTGGYSDDYLILRSPGRPYNIAGGGLRTIEIPVDSQGEKGCKNWYSYFHLIFYAGAMGQTGEMSIAFCTEDNKLIAGCNWYKMDKTGNTGCYELWANGKILATYNYTTSHIHEQNPWYSDWGHCDLRKEGSKLTFFYWGHYPTYIIPEVENMICTKIQIGIKEYDNHSMLNYYGFNNMSFDKLNVNYWEDSPNLFATGDKIEIDVDKMSIQLNGMDKVGIGKIANDWENFVLKPGMNQVKVTCSSWVNKVPTLKIKYREVYR